MPVRPTDDWQNLPTLNGGVTWGGQDYEGEIRNAIVLVDDCLVRRYGTELAGDDAAQRDIHDRVKERFSPVRSGSITVVHYRDSDGKEWWSVADGGNRYEKAQADGETMIFADIVTVPGMSEADILAMLNDKTVRKALSEVEDWHAALRSAQPNTIDKQLDKVFAKAGIMVKSGSGFGHLYAGLARVRQMANHREKPPAFGRGKGKRDGFKLVEIETALRVYRQWQEDSKDTTPIAANVIHALTIVVMLGGEDAAERAIEKWDREADRKYAKENGVGPTRLGNVAASTMRAEQGQKPSPGGSSSKAAMPYAYELLAKAHNNRAKGGRLPVTIKQ
jgi:hypothetical protein